MAYSAYHAETWANGKTIDEIKREIARCDERYYKLYPWNGTETANNTILRINNLNRILLNRADNAGI